MLHTGRICPSRAEYKGMGAADIFFLIIVFVAGLCFGSFLNVLVYRLPLDLSIVTPPSSCPSCQTRLGLVELIPLAGYLILRGRCRHCAAKISPRYPLVELVTGFIFTFTFYRFFPGMEAFFYQVFLFILLAAALIDYEHRIIPNNLIAAGFFIGVLLYLPTLLSMRLNIPAALILMTSPASALAGFLLGGLVMLIIFLVSRGGMGAGDIKMMAMIGFYVGLRGAVLVMLLAFFCGALVGLTGMAFGRLTRKDALPFAPYLALAALVQVFWGEQILNWYLNLFF